MSSDKWKIGREADVDEDEKTQLLGTYQRYKLTERPDEMLEMPEPTETIDTATVPQADVRSPRVLVWLALGAVVVVGLLAAAVSAGILFWALL